MDSFAGLAVRNSSSQRDSAAKAIVTHRNWKAARDRALEAVRRGTKMTAILGPSGVGKTLLLEDLARTLEASGVDVWLLPPGEAMCGPDDDGVVLIDEDCRLNEEAWARMFRSSGRYVIAGQPRLAEYLRTFPYGVETIFVTPIDADAEAPFNVAQLLSFREPTELVSRAAVDRLTKRAGGLPRRLKAFARSALRLADIHREKSERPPHGDEATASDSASLTANSRQVATRPGRRGWAFPLTSQRWWKWPTIGLAGVGAVFGIAVVSGQFDEAVTDAPAATAATAAPLQAIRTSPEASAPDSAPRTLSPPSTTAIVPIPSVDRSASPPSSTEGQQAAVSSSSVSPPRAPQGNDAQRPSKHRVPTSHGVKRHGKPPSSARASDKSEGG
jgi:hypothetical protein